MRLLIFRTDIRTVKKLNYVMPILNGHPNISDWSVDREDIDNVLRIEALGDLSENEVIELVEPCGLRCEVLPD